MSTQTKGQDEEPEFFKTSPFFKGLNTFQTFWMGAGLASIALQLLRMILIAATAK